MAVLKLFTEMVNSIVLYTETENVKDFQKATQYLGSVFYLDDFYEDMKRIDNEELARMLDYIKNNIQISDDLKQQILTSVIDSSKEVSNLIFSLKKKKTALSDKEKDSIKNKIMQSSVNLWWDIFDIVKTAKQIHKQSFSER